MKVRTYRHRSVESTRTALRSWSKFRHKIGTPRYVRGIFSGSKTYPWYRVVVRGDRGSIVLRGCSWGFSGEGPRGTEEVLRSLSIPPFYCIHAAFDIKTDCMNAHTWRGTREFWRIDLTGRYPALSQK